MQARYKATVVDEDGVAWVYESAVDRVPIWVMEEDAQPMLMTKKEAEAFLDTVELLPGERKRIRRA